MIVFDALYINNGGGKVLLDYLINETEQKYNNVVFLLDKRIYNKHPLIKRNKKIYLDSKGFSRFLFYLKHRKIANKIFCFGNVPPPIKCNGLVYTYFHQLLFLEQVVTLRFIEKCIFNLKTFYINRLSKNSNFWIVQTNYVKEKLIKKFNNISDSKVLILPFFLINNNYENVKEANSFLYVSSGAPHKNHIFLLKTFVNFFDKYKTGKLYLTVGNENLKLKEYIEKLFTNGYPIYNYGNISPEEVYRLYSKCRFFIFPSLIESFGLPLLEAHYSGCTIIGINKPYFKNIIQTKLMFEENNTLELEQIMNFLVNNKIIISQECLVANEINKLLKCIYE